MSKAHDKLRVWGSDVDEGRAHVGIGATVGSVIPTEGAIVPSFAGVDLGCGMIATETAYTAGDLPDYLAPRGCAPR